MLRGRLKKQSLKKDILMRLYNQRNNIISMIKIVKEDEQNVETLETELHKLDEEISYLEKIKN